MKIQLLTVAALALAGCTQAPAPMADTHDADVKAINDTEAMMAKEIGAKMWDKMASYYADDAVLQAPGGPAAVGKQAIQGMSKMMIDGDAELKFQTTKTDVAKSGDIGFTRGTYSMTMTDPKTKKKTMEKGGYVTVYKKQADGSWKIVEDINTPDSEPLTMAAEKK
jgi:uncharacterized protein (TIGR02246 family)